MHCENIVNCIYIYIIEFIFVINCRSRVKQKNERKLQRVNYIHYIHTNIHLRILYADVNTCMCTQYVHMYVHTYTIINTWGCGNSEPTAGHFNIFSLLLSCFPYTLYTAQFQFTGQSLDVLDNILHDWLFLHHCTHSGMETASHTGHCPINLVNVR